jgi:hypothetical protein
VQQAAAPASISAECLQLPPRDSPMIAGLLRPFIEIARGSMSAAPIERTGIMHFCKVRQCGDLSEKIAQMVYLLIESTTV